MGHKSKDSDFEWFEKNYIPEPMSGCWLWEGRDSGSGYGAFRYIDGKSWMAHRWSYAYHHGAIPDGMCVCHRCDNPMCVNPEHLFLGSKGDNNRDAARKGRNRWKPDRIHNLPVGERHYKAKLTTQDVEVIIASGLKQKTLASIFGVSQAHISRLKLGESWKVVTANAL